MKYPSKLYSVGESVVGKMVILMEMIPSDGIGIDDLFVRAVKKMDINDVIDAMTCMYYISSIELSKENIVYKYVKRDNL